MKAIRFHEYGDPEVLHLDDIDVPTPGAGQVRVRVAATSFNGVDANIRAGRMQGPMPMDLPHVPGLDVAGTIDALGEGVDVDRPAGRVAGDDLLQPDDEALAQREHARAVHLPHLMVEHDVLVGDGRDQAAGMEVRHVVHQLGVEVQGLRGQQGGGVVVARLGQGADGDRPLAGCGEVGDVSILGGLEMRAQRHAGMPRDGFRHARDVALQDIQVEQQAGRRQVGECAHQIATPSISA